MNKNISFSKFMQRPHLAASRMLSYALTLQYYATWQAVSAIWQARLTPQECAAIAWAALRALGPEHARIVANTVLQTAGPPLPPFISPVDEAAYWTDIATAEEHEAYCLASFKAMPRQRQLAFLEHVQGG